MLVACSWRSASAGRPTTWFPGLNSALFPSRVGCWNEPPVNAQCTFILLPFLGSLAPALAGRRPFLAGCSPTLHCLLRFVVSLTASTSVACVCFSQPAAGLQISYCGLENLKVASRHLRLSNNIFIWRWQSSLMILLNGVTSLQKPSARILPGKSQDTATILTPPPSNYFRLTRPGLDLKGRENFTFSGLW